MRKLLCYSHANFNRQMTVKGWLCSNDLDKANAAVISISTKNDQDPKHWFDDDGPSILNIEFDDVSPDMWWKDGDDDEAERLFREGDFESSSGYFDHRYKSKYGNVSDLHAMDYSDAKKMREFIELNKDRDFYLHCSAGVSRSQAVVRYILDTYHDREWETNKDNPCVCPNMHVYRMLRRVEYLGL